MRNLEMQLGQMEELIVIKEENEKRDKDKLDRMRQALIKVGSLQERAYENNSKQCNYIQELLLQVDLLKRKLKES